MMFMRRFRAAAIAVAPGNLSGCSWQGNPRKKRPPQAGEVEEACKIGWPWNVPGGLPTHGFPFLMIFPRAIRPVAFSLIGILAIGSAGAMDERVEAPGFAKWGAEALERIHADLWMEQRGLYAERRHFGGSREGQSQNPGTRRVGFHPAFMWGAGLQLTALTAAAKVEPDRYLKQARDFVDAIEVYWLGHNGISGYDVQPGPKESDRYYDDNAWIVLALLELHELAKDQKHLDRAEETHRFVMSGRDEKFGGGLYWRETPRETKNTCTNAPAIVSALRLHQITREPQHLKDAVELYEWTKKTLQDEDGLYWDHVGPGGKIDRRKFAYNTAVMIRAACLLHQITGMAEAAEKHWVRPDGAIADGGQFAHMLLEAFVELDEAAGGGGWSDLARKSVVYVRENLRDENGRYGSRWDRPVTEPVNHVMLLHQASAARELWVAADVFRDGGEKQND
jgi:hypothetical protein